MGFSLEFLVWRQSARADDPGLAPLLAGLPGARRHCARPFRDRAELQKQLRSGRLSLVYSNVRHDRRLTQSGLLGFSLRNIEMGLAGALRTLNRLLERCEAPFFRENSRYLRDKP
jgi:hypothetical protein